MHGGKLPMEKTTFAKKYWSAPVLTVYGSLTEITKQDKVPGDADGLILISNGIGPIQNAS